MYEPKINDKVEFELQIGNEMVIRVGNVISIDRSFSHNLNVKIQYRGGQFWRTTENTTPVR